LLIHLIGFGSYYKEMEGDEETLKGQSGGEKAAETEEEEEAGIHPPSRSINKRKEKCASQIFVCRNTVYILYGNVFLIP
jgi:hypothetical protein